MRKLLFPILALILALGLVVSIATPALAATTTLNPSAAGSATNLPRTGAATSNWQACQTSNGDTSYVSWGADETWTFMGIPGYDLYALPDPALTGTITSVIVYIEARAVPTTIQQASAQTVIRTHNTTYYGGTATTIGGGTTYTLTNSYATYSYTYSTNPNTTSTWTWAEVNDLQAGVALRRANTGGVGPSWESRCTHVWVDVNYTPGGGPTVDHFGLNDVALITAGNRAAYTVTRYDASNNPVTSGVNTVYLYTNSTGGKCQILRCCH